MHDLATALKRGLNGGVFQLACDVRAVETAAKAADLACFRIDTEAVHDKSALLAALARGLDFPDWFGNNWDALADCLTDLSWHEADGYVLVLENVEHFATVHEQDYEAMLEVMRHASDYWRDEEVPFWVFVAGVPECTGARERRAELPVWPTGAREDG